MRLLDLFAGPGGATVGYERAGWEVTGVDLEPWACYPGVCHEADAMAVLRGEVEGLEPWRFDAIHASPPCQRYSVLHSTYDPEAWPDLLGPTVELLEAIGKPYIVENVPGSGVATDFDIMLCGSMFPGLTVRRHRYFRTRHWPGPLMAPASCNHTLEVEAGGMGQMVRGSVYNYGKKNVKLPIRQYLDGLGLTWVEDKSHEGRRLGGQVEAIPPHYTEWLGAHLLEALRAQ